MLCAPEAPAAAHPAVIYLRTAFKRPDAAETGEEAQLRKLLELEQPQAPGPGPRSGTYMDPCCEFLK